jgi:hypothetical protein
MGALKMGGAMAITDVLNDFLREKFTEKKFGYGAGITQGALGAFASGTAFGGGNPIIGGVNALLYGVKEGVDVNSDTNAALRDTDIQNKRILALTAFRLHGATTEDVGARASRLKRDLGGQIQEKLALSNVDSGDFKGFWGKISMLFSGRQNTDTQQKTLAFLQQQLAVLNRAEKAGDSQVMLSTLQSIEAELVKWAGGPQAGKENAPQNLPTMQSDIKVDISVKDADRISSEITMGIIEPLARQLADLQIQVNSLLNKENPKPAEVR